MAYAPLVTGTGVIGWEFLSRTREKQQAVFEKSPMIARDTARFAAQIQSIQTSEQLMENRDLLRVALGAFGLDDDLNNRAFIKKVLESDLSDTKSLANRLADKRYLALAQSFNFAGTSGPRVEAVAAKTDDLAARLDKVATPDDLLSDAGLLRATLRSFDLEKDSRNVFFLKEVLNSDLADANSFVNRLSDKRYVDLAKTFDFHRKGKEAGTLGAFADAVAGKLDRIATADDLLADPEMTTAALTVFGLQHDFANIDRRDFLRNVLQSDPYDANSFAAGLEDKRYLALSNAFALGDPDRGESKAEKLVEALSGRAKPLTSTDELFRDVGFTLKAMDFFGLPQGAGKIDVARRMVESDRDNPASLLNITPDRRYRAFADAFDFAPAASGRSYSASFVDSITRNYLDRQFENGVGESDPNMRIALSLERDLEQVTKQRGGVDSQWFSVMASKPLRTVFETAFRLPSSFGALDLDQQLSVFKERSERIFGTDKVADFTQPDRLDQLRRQFLLASDQQVAGGFSSGAGVVLALLSGSAG